jgi:regulatory protein
MGKITAITTQRRPGRYNIMVDGTFALAVSEKVLADLKLSVGQEINEIEAEKAAEAEETHKALTAALRFLEVRARSENEIQTRLKTHGYNQSTINTVIARLRGFGLVDDEQFANAWIESRSRSQPGGVHKLKSELSQKGVDRTTVDRAVAQITEESQLDLARKALSKRRQSSYAAPEERRAAYARDAGFLARRGFGWNIAQAVLKERFGRIDDYD